jgi:formiminoglutamase
VATTRDPKWPPAAALVHAVPQPERRNVALVGVPTHATSVSPRSSTSTPAAVREALARYSTWSYSDRVDLVDAVALVDYGDVEDPDGEGGRDRVAAAMASIDSGTAMTIVLGGDNAATWHALGGLAQSHLGDYGLITLDAHLDLREGRSNGSPVRQLLEEGLDGRHVVQLGLGDFSNSAAYARDASEAGITVIERDAFRTHDVTDLAARALEVAAAGGRPVYVDIDLDVCDRAVVPGCPAAVPGGISADEARRFVRSLCQSRAVRALDVTEIDVEQDAPDGRTVRLAALVVLEALAGVQRRVA